MNLKAGVVLLLALGGGFSAANDNEIKLRDLEAPSFYFQIFGGQSMTILGSEDRRTTFGIGLAYGRPEPRFHVDGVASQLVYEVYYDRNSSRGASGQPPNEADTFGALAYARFRWPTRQGFGFYATAGWGLQYTDETSVDLDSKINSTPMLGFGISWNGPGRRHCRLKISAHFQCRNGRPEPRPKPTPLGLLLEVLKKTARLKRFLNPAFLFVGSEKLFHLCENNLARKTRLDWTCDCRVAGPPY